MSTYSFDAADPRVSVVVPNYNGAHWLCACLDALAAQQFRDFEVIIVDNGSSDGSVALLEEDYRDVHLIRFPENRGFALAVNEGIRAARGEYVALLNNDTVARPGWLGALVQAMETGSEDVAAIASLMLSLDDPDVVDNAGDNLSWTGAAEKIGHGQPAIEYRNRKEIFSPSGGATLYRRTFLESLGGFDSRFFAYLEDVDLGLRGRLLGSRYFAEPGAEVLHKGHGSAIRRQDYVRLITRNRLMVFAKNVPWTLLLKHLFRLIYGQLYFLIVYRRPWHSLTGYVSFVMNVPHVLRERKKMNRLRRIPFAELDGLLSKTMSEPPLRSLLARRIGRRRS